LQRCPSDLAELAARLRRGEVGMLPTDTLYGLSGTLAALPRILMLKGRSKPPAVVPPSTAWVTQRTGAAGEIIERFAGPYLMLWPCDDPTLPPALISTGFLGVRLPRHWIRDLAAQLGEPIITTSANRSGDAPARHPDELPVPMQAQIEFAVDEGILPGPPSRLVWCDRSPPRIVPDSR
jgi:L-threonylcarbamoyladenylate synthase